MKYQWKIELCGYTAHVASLAACLGAHTPLHCNAYTPWRTHMALANSFMAQREIALAC